MMGTRSDFSVDQFSRKAEIDGINDGGCVNIVSSFIILSEHLFPIRLRQ